MNILLLLVMILVGYLSGSVSYATALTRLVSGKEIREMGSRNPGTLNVGANIGKPWGFLVAFLDGMKSFLPMLVTKMVLSGNSEIFLFFAMITVGAAAIVGHWKPLFHNFRGGQCVGTAIGVFLFIIPVEFLFSFISGALLIFFVVRPRTEKWVRWVPVTLILLVPIVTVLANAFFDISIFANVSLGGHPWYWMLGIGAVVILMLLINLSYLRKRITGVNQKSQ
jgi:acyl-phosphate glycerol 3-phosphate acyltransferase